MLKIVALYFCWAIFLVSGDGKITEQGAPKTVGQASGMLMPPEPDQTTVNPPITTLSPNVTTHAPETTTKTPVTTQPPATTTPTPKTTTTPTPPPTTTTTPAPSTTTPAPTPTPKPEPTPTPKPEPTPTPKPEPTTTPKPVPTTPVPAPKDGTWVVNGTNQTCIVIQMAAQFNVSYVNKDNKTVHKLLTLPTESGSTNVTGECGLTEQNINITWHAGNDSLNIHFVKNETTKRYTMHHVELSLGAHEFPDSASNETMKFVHEADQFPTGLSNSYRCLRLQKLDLKRAGFNGTFGDIEVSDLQFQAFRSEKTSNFSDAHDCSPDVPDVVPIAVGCALTALVIIILAAYLVGRRRSQARGYLSM